MPAFLVRCPRSDTTGHCPVRFDYSFPLCEENRQSFVDSFEDDIISLYYKCPANRAILTINLVKKKNNQVQTKSLATHEPIY